MSSSPSLSTSENSKLSPHLLSATFLVAGTCIGGGMLALPVVCGSAGLFPSLAYMALTWAIMTLTALCLVEIGFWMTKEDAHIVSMSKKMLGPVGQWISWALFLFISYSSLIAYTGGSGHLISEAIGSITNGSFTPSKEMGCILFTLLFGPFIFVSHYTLGKANSYLFYGMIISYFLIIGSGIQHIDPQFFLRMDWSEAPKSVPFLLTSFSFQTMVPSLHPYLGHDKRSLRISVIAGTLLAFVVYALWQFVVIGSVSWDGPHGLQEAYLNAQPATYSLSHSTNNQFLGLIASAFAFLSLVTSYFGISMGLFDFLSDGLSISKKGRGALFLGALVLIPSLFFAMKFESVFLLALDLSGGFGDTILNGLIPIIMLWTGWTLYTKKQLTFKMKAGLILLAVAYLFAFSIEVKERFISGETLYDNKVVDVIEIESDK